MIKWDGAASLEFDRVIDLEPAVLVKCDGTSIWTNTAGWEGLVSRLTVKARKYGDGPGDVYVHVNVDHDFPSWEIYTDEGFEKEISEIMSAYLGDVVQIQFTEQGMQDFDVASMEPANERSKEWLISLGEF